MRSRNWCFTKYGDLENPAELSIDDDRVRYCVWQLEKCPSTGRNHLQGYIEFRNPVRMGGVKRIFGDDTLHLEARRGSRKQAVEYCTKEDSRVQGPWTIGTEPKQGERRDLHGVAELISSGCTMDEVRTLHPVDYIRYRRGIEALHARELVERSREFRMLEVHVYYGEAGTGKTRAAVDGSDDYYILDQGERVWFDGYEGESLLIIDDFYGWIKYGMLLRILDGYQLRLEIKGGFTYALWKRVIITSNKPPEEWYAHGMTPALARRITKRVHFANLVNA